MAKTTLAAAALLALAGCGQDSEPPRDVSANDVREEAKQAADAAQDYTRKEVDDFRSEARRRLDQMEQSLQDAQKRAAELSGEAQRNAQAALDRAQEQAERLRQQLDALRDDAVANWRATREGLQRALADLQDRVARAIAALRGDHSEPPPPADRSSPASGA